LTCRAEFAAPVDARPHTAAMTMRRGQEGV
jgi:hypothetical protein